MQARIRYKASLFRPRVKTEQDILDICREGFERAAASLIKEVDERVPVKTGMAKGAFGGLAQFANAPLDLSGAEPQKGYLPDGSRVFKDAALGRTQAQRPPYLRRKGRNFVFSFETRVYHYLLRDINAVEGGGKPTPWLSAEYGIAAFEKTFVRYMKRNLSRVLVPTITINEKGIVSELPVDIRKFRNRE